MTEDQTLAGIGRLLSALRNPLSAGRFPLAAIRFPLSANAELNNPITPQPY